MNLGYIGIRDNESTTATVTINHPATTDSLVSLKTNGANVVSIPASVIIRAGQTSANFTISGNSGRASTAGTLATVSAKLGIWTQSDILTVVPQSMSLAAQNIVAQGGAQCVLLTWNDLPADCVAGFDIYRSIGNQIPVQINTTPIKVGTFADSTAQAGQTYQYMVVTKRWTSEQIPSSWVTSTPSQSNSLLSWSAPTTDTQGILNLTTSYTPDLDGQVGEMTLFVDGALVERNCSVDTVARTISAGINSSDLPDGDHVVQFITDISASTAVASPPFVVTVRNTANSLSVTPLGDASKGEIINIHINAVAANPSVTISVTGKISGQVVRSWTVGDGSVSDLSWDGTDANGANLPTGSYLIQTTANAGGSLSNGAIAASAPLILASETTVLVLGGKPSAMALINYDPVNDSKKQCVKLLNAIESAYAVGATRVPGSSLVPLMNYTALNGRVGSKIVDDLKDYMQHSLVDFYLYSHGSRPQPDANGHTLPQRALWGRIRFYPYVPDGANIVLPARTDAYVFDVTKVLESRNLDNQPYNFVWMDNCNSAGGDAKRVPEVKGPVDPMTWFTAFGVDPWSGVFIGSVGEMGLIKTLNADDPRNNSWLE